MVQEVLGAIGEPIPAASRAEVVVAARVAGMPGGGGRYRLLDLVRTAHDILGVAGAAPETVPLAIEPEEIPEHE